MSSSNNCLRSGTHMLDRFIHNDDTIGDGLYRRSKGWDLRHEPAQTQTTHDVQMDHTEANPAVLKKGHRDEEEVRQLEKEMDALTDPQLLRNAQRDQDGKPASL
jgi:hypothetical protein